MTAVAIVATVPTIAHAEMMGALYMGTIIVMMSFIEAASSVPVPTMASAIGGIKAGTSEIEVFTMGIACVHTKMPIACIPIEGTVEIGGCTEQIPLPGIEDEIQVGIASLPVSAEDVGPTCYAHQVIEVYLIGCLILCIRQIEFVCHLISKEQCLAACLFITHGTRLTRHGQHCNEGK